jgi:hypothetical protein
MKQTNRRRGAVKVGFNRQAAFKEVEPYLTGQELAEVREQERQEQEGNSPRSDYLGELYGEFERESREYMQILTESIGIEVALMEGAEPDMRELIRGLIAADTNKIESLRKEILNDRATLTELKRLQRRR